jgi:ABC-type multidrug transport system fused ATPase/permease subunit
MDEATSALDNETELKIMSAIIKEFPFVAKVIVAHRLSTLSSCDKILELDNGKLVKIWSNKEFKTHFQV